ncbi:MAG: hypothetical protein JW829_06400 [Pirellulales bacterium]|nr:hypothetical protein [Pirellulales bacterium]
MRPLRQTPRRYEWQHPFLPTNAIYFKGTWADPFEEDRTHPAPFDIGDIKVQVLMMNRLGYFRYGLIGNLQILDLPYVVHDPRKMAIRRPRPKIFPCCCGPQRCAP